MDKRTDRRTEFPLVDSTPLRGRVKIGWIFGKGKNGGVGVGCWSHFQSQKSYSRFAGLLLVYFGCIFGKFCIFRKICNTIYETISRIIRFDYQVKEVTVADDADDDPDPRHYQVQI